MRHSIAKATRAIRVGRPVATAGLALLALLAAAGCDTEVTVPVQREPNFRPASVITITPGLTAYTDRASWTAAVIAASSTAQLFNFSPLDTGRVTQTDTDYGLFHLTVDRASATPSNNPGTHIIADGSCSLETGDCMEFVFNMVDPDITSGDSPHTNTLVFGQNVIGFFGYFAQTGVTGSGTVTGPIAMHFGADSVVINDYLASGYGFFGVVSTNPSLTISFTYQQAVSLQNDIIEVYNPTYAFAPAPPPGGGTAEEQLEDLLAFINGLNLLKGDTQSFTDKLDAFAAALANGRTAKACTELDKFMKKVNDKTPKHVLPADAAAMLEMVNGLKETLECGGGAG